MATVMAMDGSSASPCADDLVNLEMDSQRTQ